LIALRTVHNQGVDFTTADRLEGFLRLPQLLFQLLDFGEFSRLAHENLLRSRREIHPDENTLGVGKIADKPAQRQR